MIEPMAPPPRPWMTRPATTHSMLGASPATTNPMAKQTVPATNGSSGPRRSASSPASVMPTRLVSQ
jgi:hypothetical protein